MSYFWQSLNKNAPSTGVIPAPKARALKRSRTRKPRSGRSREYRVYRLYLEFDADSDDVNGPFRRDVNKSERSDAGICNDARDYSHESRDGLFLAGMGAWGKGTAFEVPCPTPAL